MMKSALAVLTLALSAAISPAYATPPPPAPPPDVDPAWFFEAPTGVYDERYDDYGSEVTVAGKGDRWLLLSYWDEENVTLYSDTRRGSRFYLTSCDEFNSQGEPIRVSRKQFMDRVADTPERAVVFTYDAERNSGTFVATTGYFAGEPYGNLYPCPDLPIPQD